MKRLLPALFAATLSVCYFHAAAQTDSTHFNLGRIKLRKDFTQNITIKGADLERMPFSSLTEALNVWMQGVYTWSGTVQYVVDGLVVADVNRYSIYDIEEVTFVQNAAVQLNGATNQRQLVLVKTKRNYTGKEGIVFASQTFLTKPDKPMNAGPDYKSESKGYHQYHLSAFHNGEKIQFGVSANFMRDVFPYDKGNAEFTKTNPTFNRYRFNGWLQWQLNAANRLQVSMNYTPQPEKYEVNFVGSASADSTRTSTRSYILNPTITLQSAWTRNLHNELSISYVSQYYRNNGRNARVNYLGSNPNLTITDSYHKTTVKNFVAGNHTTYTIQAGSWQIEPALNVMFRYIEQSDSVVSRTVYVDGPNLPVITNSYSWTGGLRRLFLLTPSVGLSYKNMLNLQGGLIYDASDYNGAKYKKAFPFASATVDVLKIAAPGQASSLKIYGSWAQSAGLADYNGTLSDYSGVGYNPASFRLPGGGFGGMPVFSPDPIDSSTWAIQLGAAFHTAKNRLVISYNYEKRDFTPWAYRYVPGPWGSQELYSYPVFLSSAHRLSILARVLETQKFNWFSGLNVTTIKLKTDEGDFVGVQAIGDYKTEDPSWTGGFVNRLSYKGIVFGADVLYRFDQQQPGPALNTTVKVNSVVLQNVYAGYQFKLPKGRNLEVYADSRNLVRNEKSYLRNRKFYGLGLKAQL